jgi:hypothetical protein
MNLVKTFTAAALTLSILGGPLAAMAADQPADPKAAKAKPYTLKTCIVSGEKLGEMGKPFVFVHEGREIKLCCKDCQKDFKKDPAKYVTKLEKEEAKAKNQGKL